MIRKVVVIGGSEEEEGEGRGAKVEARIGRRETGGGMKKSIVEEKEGLFVSSRRRHTRYWRDWSSDVCSSDLGRRPHPRPLERHHGAARGHRRPRRGLPDPDPAVRAPAARPRRGLHPRPRRVQDRRQIGRASWWERV